MRERQFFMGSPKMRNETPAARKWAAIDRPYGPAPMMATSIEVGICNLRPA
jgi:hypothetical protein